MAEAEERPRLSKSLYVITKQVRGIPLLAALKKASDAEKENIVQSVAKQLSALHKKGFYHGHFHGENVIIYSTMARIIDASLVERNPEGISQEEMDHTFKRDVDRMYGSVRRFRDDLGKLFWKTYWRERKKWDKR